MRDLHRRRISGRLWFRFVTAWDAVAMPRLDVVQLVECVLNALLVGDEQAVLVIHGDAGWESQPLRNGSDSTQRIDAQSVASPT